MEIRLGLLALGDIVIGAVNAEVFNPIAQRLKRESPYARTMMATLTNGMARSGYIPHDAGFGMYTFEVLSSRLQPGCAESAIVNGLLDLHVSRRRLTCSSGRAAARLAHDELGRQYHRFGVLSGDSPQQQIDEQARAAREILPDRRQRTDARERPSQCRRSRRRRRRPESSTPRRPTHAWSRSSARLASHRR